MINSHVVGVADENKQSSSDQGKASVLLSFSVQQYCCLNNRINEELLSKKLKELNCEFIINRGCDDDERKIVIAVEITQAKFTNVRRVVFDAILEEFPSVWIEPKDVNHIFFESELSVKVEEGAFTNSSDGFKFYSGSNVLELKDLNNFHDRFYDLEGKFVIYDEAAQHYVLIVKNANKWNSYARLGKGDIPEIFHKFRIYHAKITVLAENETCQSEVSDEIKYYMRYVQDKCPLVRITARIMSDFKQGLQKISVSNSFSENALAMSVYTAEFSKILQSHPFFNEDSIVTLMESSHHNEFPKINASFIRSITSNGSHDYQVHLPELAESNNLFKKFGTDGFVKVQSIGQVPNELQFNGHIYLPFGGSTKMIKERTMYFYNSLVFESVESITSQFGESIEPNQLCESETLKINNIMDVGCLSASMIYTLMALGVQQSNLQHLFEEWYNYTLSNITNSKFLLELLKRRCRSILPSVELLSELPDEPFIEDLLRHSISALFEHVQTNLIIPVEKSTRHITVDDSSYLKEDEIMISLGSDKYLEDGTIVLVCNNPCLSPSDVKLFTVRNYESLKTNQSANHSHAIIPNNSNMNCEDLFASWDSRLVPTNQGLLGQFTSSSYRMPTIQSVDLMVQILDGWLATTDKEGALSKNSVELSHLYHEVRNGKSVSLPNWFNTIEYPEFMERSGKPFNSKSIIGMIYHKLELMKNNKPKDVSIDLSHVKKGQVFEKLNNIKNLVEYLKQVNNCTLFELFTSEKSRLISQIGFVSAEEYNNAIEGTPKFDIISWLIPNNKKEYPTLSMEKKLSNSISRYLEKFRLDQLEKIESKLNGYKMKQADDIFLVGSLSILLHDPENTDCDWFIEPVSDNPTFFDDLCHRLSSHFIPIKEEYHKSVPLFRMYLQDSDLRFLELIDLTNGDTGFRKKHHMRLYFAQQPKLLVILRILFDLMKKICSFHIKTFQLTWEIVDFCILKNYIHRERPPTRQESVDQEKQTSDVTFMKLILSKCAQVDNFEKESELIIDFMKSFKLKNNMEFPDNLDDSKSYSATSDERKIEFAHNLIQTCLVNSYLYKDFSKAILPTLTIQKTFENFKSVDAKPVFRAEAREFVDGSVTTIFKGDSGETPINFTYYKGHVHAQHAKLPIHRPSLESYNAECKNIISPEYEQKLSSQLVKMEDKPENYVFIIRFGVYYLVNMQKSIFSEITKPENSSVFNECMRKKAKVVKGPSADSFATGVSESVISLLRPSDSLPTRMTEYSVSFYKNVNNKSTEFKVRLDENMKLKTKVISGQTRVISHTFIGKSNDMRFYINHLQYLDENNDISELVDKLDKKGWMIKQGATDSEIVFNKKLELIKTIRMEERETYLIQHDGQEMELDIVKVKTFNLPQNSKNQTLLFKEEHYEVEITLPNQIIHSSNACLSLVDCGINYWDKCIDQ